MKRPSIFFRLFSVGVFLLSFAFSVSVSAHQVGSQNGNANHQHVYKRSTYGNGVIEGHYAQPPGSRGIVIWRAAPSRSYARTQPGFRIPPRVPPQPSLKQMYKQKPASQMYRQKPVFSKNQRLAPSFYRK